MFNMKTWQKLTVVGVALILVSTIYAAQYIGIQTEAELTVDTTSASAQIAAHDPSVADNDADYLLEYDGTNFNLNLGTWGDQNTFKSSNASLLVNAGGNDLVVTGVNVGGIPTDALDIYLHDGMLGRDPGTPGDAESVHIFDSTDASSEQMLDSADYVTLVAPEEGPYNGDTTEMAVQEDSGTIGAATPQPLGADGTSNDHWVYEDDFTGTDFNTGDPNGILDGFDSDSNAAWVYIDITNAQDFSGETIEFYIEDA